jgi:ABC-2 type transport system permease protein
LALEELRQGALRGVVSDDAATAAALGHLPLPLLLIFRAILLFLPIYVALMAFDQLSGELGTRSLRYLAMRTRRAAIVVGKLAGQATLLLGLILVVLGGVVAYVALTDPLLSAGPALGALLRFTVAAFGYSLAYLGLTALCSALVSAPVVALLLNLTALLALWVAGLMDLPPAVRVLLPSHHMLRLLHPEALSFAAAAGTYLLFAVTLTLATTAVLRARDL